MILPSKTCSLSTSLLGLGSLILEDLTSPKTVSNLWDRIRSNDSQIPFDKFILTLDLLFLIKVVEFEDGLLRRKPK